LYDAERDLLPTYLLLVILSLLRFAEGVKRSTLGVRRSKLKFTWDQRWIAWQRYHSFGLCSFPRLFTTIYPSISSTDMKLSCCWPLSSLCICGQCGFYHFMLITFTYWLNDFSFVKVSGTGCIKVTWTCFRKSDTWTLGASLVKLLQECSWPVLSFPTALSVVKNKMATVNDVCLLAAILSDLCDDIDTNILHILSVPKLYCKMQMCRK